MCTDGAVGNVAGVFIQQQIAVDFIGADHQIVARSDGIDGQQLVTGEDSAARVVGVAEQQQICGGGLTLKLCQIQHPATRLFNHRHCEQGTIIEARRLQEGVIDRLGGDDAAAMLAPRLAGKVEPRHHAGQEYQPFGLDSPAIAGRHPFDNEFDQARRGA